MKLLLCPVAGCADVRKLQQKTVYCQCGASWGRYRKDGISAIFGGMAIPLGFDNSSLVEAVMKQPEDGRGKRFTAFVIPKTVVFIDYEEASIDYVLLSREEYDELTDRTAELEKELAVQDRALWAVIAVKYPRLSDARRDSLQRQFVARARADLACEEGKCEAYDDTTPPIEDTLQELAAEVPAEEWETVRPSDDLDGAKRIAELEKELAVLYTFIAGMTPIADTRSDDVRWDITRHSGMTAWLEQHGGGGCWFLAGDDVSDIWTDIIAKARKEAERETNKEAEK